MITPFRFSGGGSRMDEIPGIGRIAAAIIIATTGAEHDRFPLPPT